jgi:DNA-directed RNA polymerase specialized sigma24 family protein
MVEPGKPLHELAPGPACLRLGIAMHTIEWPRATPSTPQALPRASPARPGAEAALNNEAARLHAIEDSVHAVNEFFNGLEDALLRVGEPRLLAIIELYEELGSYQRVAGATELSKTRVGQLVREARRRGL